MITRDVDSMRQLTIHACSGKVTVDEVLSAIANFYNSDPTPYTLWDMTAAEVADIRSDDVERVAKFAKTYDLSRAGGKTAIVSSGNFVFGLARMYQSFAEMSGQRVEVQVFRSVDEAKSWLTSIDSSKGK